MILLRKARTFIKLIKGSITYPYYKQTYKLPKILSIEESLDKIIHEKMSVCRFGDSEYLYLTGGSDGLQTTNEKLRQGLKRALLNRNPKLLVSLVNYEETEGKTWRAKMSAKMFHSRTISGYYQWLDKSYIYGNSNMTRFYIGRKDKSESGRLFKKCKELWQDRDIIVFEGQNTRFGYGNDLFDNATSVKRVLCPSKGAFDVYDEIIQFAQTMPKEALLIFALGASATVAAADMSDLGYQAIDIGNLDIEYEWFRQGATKVVAIKNKQVSEATGGLQVGALKDKKYISQILTSIG